MQSDLQDFFEFVCSKYDYEISELLKDSEYKSLCEEAQAREKELYKALGNKEDFINSYRDAIENKISCYHEHAAIAALKHLIKFLRESNIL